MVYAEIEDKELRAHLASLPRDGMAVFVMAGGRIRGALFHGTEFVNRMRVQHGLGVLETMVLGQAALCGALMIPMMKGRERISWKYESDGPAAGFSIEADSAGSVRGFLFNERIPVEAPISSWDIRPFLGTGTMTVSRIHAEDRFPRTSTVAVGSGSIADDLAAYYGQSEQVHTAFNTGIQYDSAGRVVGAGGMFLQVMPESGGTIGAEPDSGGRPLLEAVELAFRTAPSLGQWFGEGGSSDDLIYGLFREFAPSVAVRRDVSFFCPCSEESFLAQLRGLPASQLEEIRRDGPDPLEICCRNCGSVYRIPVKGV
ncbi:MAG: Hsp33 family molecular chaperone HslO [Treponemataceae bacterium]|nr:Hsp33 family molecular chaperone HslO [Treponemataceae bacterium]